MSQDNFAADRAFIQMGRARKLPIGCLPDATQSAGGCRWAASLQLTV